MSPACAGHNKVSGGTGDGTDAGSKGTGDLSYEELMASLQATQAALAAKEAAAGTAPATATAASATGVPALAPAVPESATEPSSKAEPKLRCGKTPARLEMLINTAIIHGMAGIYFNGD